MGTKVVRRRSESVERTTTYFINAFWLVCSRRHNVSIAADTSAILDLRFFSRVSSLKNQGEDSLACCIRQGRRNSYGLPSRDCGLLLSLTFRRSRQMKSGLKMVIICL
jgi:hypothetical protein